jgi:hypothetical protein
LVSNDEGIGLILQEACDVDLWKLPYTDEVARDMAKKWKDIAEAVKELAKNWEPVELPFESTINFLWEIQNQTCDSLYLRLPQVRRSVQIERDLFCRVCQAAARDADFGPHQRLVQIRTEGRHGAESLMYVAQAANLAWTREGFFRHIRECPCIPMLRETNEEVQESDGLDGSNELDLNQSDLSRFDLNDFDLDDLT